MTSLRLLFSSCALAALAAACGSNMSPDPDPGTPEPVNPVLPNPPAVPCDAECFENRASADAHPQAQRLVDIFDRHYAAQGPLSYQQLLAQHAQPYVEDIGLDPSQAEHHADFVTAFGLSTQAQTVLDQLGFVVVPAPPRLPSEQRPGETTAAGPADVYYRIFAADLPVYITADSILHAWHRSFGRLLEGAETWMMAQVLEDMLAKMTNRLAGVEGQAGLDALFYAGVARELFDPSWNPPLAVRDEIEAYVELVKAEQMQYVSFLGVPTWIDFSQFQPRGHYTRTELLSRYFRAVMWLGRVDLVLDPRGELPRPREEAAARVLAQALDESGSIPLFDHMDAFYAAFVGQSNTLTPRALLALCAQAGLAACEGKASGMTAVYAEQPSPAYSSRVFAAAVPPLTMRFFPQRFAYDAWVTNQTTTPRLEPAVQGGRAMAMPEDVAFALGNPRALVYHEEDMLLPLRENLPATLAALRATVDELSPGALEGTAYTHWLEALRAVSRPQLDETLPRVLRTAAWQDRKLEAVLASWAELRHDTVLAVEQSVGGEGCQYPHGYVDPVPELYRSLSRSAAALAPLFTRLLEQGNVPNAVIFESVPAFLTYHQETMERLATMAEKQLAGEELDAEDLLFLERTVDQHADDSYFGTRSYDGWYPRLFWRLTGWSADRVVESGEEHPSGVADPLVVDVHTDAEKESALEAAVGYPGLLVIALERGDGVVLYGGPVASFYGFHQPLAGGRLTDEQWRARIESATVPARPAFARSYWVE
jgi:hypothetical protein